MPAGPLRAPLPAARAHRRAGRDRRRRSPPDGVAADDRGAAAGAARAVSLPDAAAWSRLARQARAGVRRHRRSREILRDAAPARHRRRGTRRFRRSSSAIRRAEIESLLAEAARRPDAGDDGKGPGPAAASGCGMAGIAPFPVTLAFDDTAALVGCAPLTGARRERARLQDERSARPMRVAKRCSTAPAARRPPAGRRSSISAPRAGSARR